MNWKKVIDEYSFELTLFIIAVIMIVVALTGNPYNTTG